MVAAVADNGVIGAQGDIPWRIPEDFAHFKRITLGHTLIMGRATYESIGRPLPGRTTVVLTGIEPGRPTACWSRTTSTRRWPSPRTSPATW